MSDAISLSIPRLMTGGEVMGAILSATPVFIERRDEEGKEPGDDRWAMLTAADGGDMSCDRLIAMSTYITEETLFKLEFKLKWRCWTGRPTYEQRIAQPWDDEIDNA